MIFYISSEENQNLFDRIVNENDFINKFVGKFSLEKILIEDMAKLGHFKRVIIDLLALKDSEEEFLMALNTYSKIGDARIIILANNLEKDDILLEKIIELGFYNIIIEKDYNAFKEEASRVLISDKTKEEALIMIGAYDEDDERLKEPRKSYTFLSSEKIISLFSSREFSGATTISFQLANFLAISGASVVFITNVENEVEEIKFKNLMKHYKIKKVKEGYYKYKNFDIYTNKCSDIKYNDTNFIIIDMGVLSEDSYYNLAEKRENILITHSKPYELSLSENIINKYSFNSIILQSCDEDKKANVSRIFKKTDTYFSHYAPSLQSDSNFSLFKNILSEYIIEV